MDAQALEGARSRGRAHRLSIANLVPAVRELVGEIRVNGRAKKEKVGGLVTSRGSPAAAAALASNNAATIAKPNVPPPKKELSGEELLQDTDECSAEMDGIMNRMGRNISLLCEEQISAFIVL